MEQDHHYLSGELVAELVTESDPRWDIMGTDDQYALKLRKTKHYTRMYRCRHGQLQHMFQRVVPDQEWHVIKDDMLDSPLELVRNVLSRERLNLLEFEVATVADFLVELRNRVSRQPGTKVIAVIDVAIVQIELVDYCVRHVPTDPREIMDVNSGWVAVNISNGDNGSDWYEIREEEDDAAACPITISLPGMKYDGVGQDTCSICFDKFSEEEDEFYRTSCSHNFHAHCLGTWMTRTRTCPLCRNYI